MSKPTLQECIDFIDPTRSMGPIDPNLSWSIRSEITRMLTALDAAPPSGEEGEKVAGFPLVIDEDMEPGVIEAKVDGQTVGRIVVEPPHTIERIKEMREN